MEAHPEATEGTLTHARAGMVNTRSLARLARRLGMGRWVRLDRGEESAGGRGKPSILANVFEAVLGAIYLDAGLQPVRALVRRELGEQIAEPGAASRDDKTRLQELLHARGEAPPVYVTTDESGPPHEREFRVEVRSGGRCLGDGLGRSKRSAEQRAARRALEALER